MTTGEKLKILMTTHGITQDQLGDMSRNSQPSIHRMIKGKQQLNFDVLHILRNKYQADINWLLDDK